MIDEMRKSETLNDRQLIKRGILGEKAATKNCIVANYSVGNLHRPRKIQQAESLKLGCEVEDECHYYKRREGREEEGVNRICRSSNSVDSRTGNIVQFA